MPLSEIASIVRDLLCDSQIEVVSGTRFEDLNGWDSMDLVSVVVEVECRFDLQFDWLEIDRLTMVGDLVRMIVAKQGLVAA